MIFCSLIWVELPLLDVHHPLPDGVPHDVLLDPGQHREWGVLVRKALKQHPRHLPPLYPVTIRKIILHHTCFCKRFPVLKIVPLPPSLLSSLLGLQQDFQMLRFVPEKNKFFFKFATNLILLIVEIISHLAKSSKPSC